MPIHPLHSTLTPKPLSSFIAFLLCHCLPSRFLREGVCSKHWIAMAKVFALFLLALLAISMLHTTVSLFEPEIANERKGKECMLVEVFYWPFFVVFVSGFGFAWPWRSPLRPSKLAFSHFLLFFLHGFRIVCECCFGSLFSEQMRLFCLFVCFLRRTMVRGVWRASVSSELCFYPFLFFSFSLFFSGKKQTTARIERIKYEIIFVESKMCYNSLTHFSFSFSRNRKC